MPELVPGLVSVIVPIFNVEAYLRDCLDSIRSQTHRELQVILVDDGSTDGSMAIAEEFVAADDRFQLIRQANAGLSAARNTGIPYATGEFLAFVDSDDVLAAFAYELMMRAARVSGSDFVTGGVHRLRSHGHKWGYPHAEVFKASALKTHVSEDNLLLRDRTIWNKLFRRTFWDEHAFTFPVGRLFEDAPVTIPAHAYAKHVSVLDVPIYFWRVREGAQPSITQSDHDTRNIVDRFYSVELVRERLIASGHHELLRVYQEMAIWDKLSNFLQFLPNASDDYRRVVLGLANKYLDEVGDDAIDRLPPVFRQQWRLIRDGRTDELIELVNAGVPEPEAPETAAAGLKAAAQQIDWDGDRLNLRGFAFVDGAGAARRWSTVRQLWLRRGGSRRPVPLATRTVRDAEAEGIAEDDKHAYDWSGFTASIDLKSLRVGGAWKTCSWQIGVAVTGGITVKRGKLTVDEDAGVVLPERRRVAPGTWVLPVAARGQLRVQVQRPTAYIETIRRVGDEAELVGVITGKVGKNPQVHLVQTKGVVTRSVTVTVERRTEGGSTFTVRLPLGGLGLDDHTENHTRGLHMQRMTVELEAGGEPLRHLVADHSCEQVRVLIGTDEVYTHLSRAGYLWIGTRPAGPVLTSAQWRPDGALLLQGDSPRPLDGDLVLRRRGIRRDVYVPLHSTESGWQVVLDPTAVPGLGGTESLGSGVWDVSFHPAGVAHDLIPPLGVTSATLRSLPAATEIETVRYALDEVNRERVVLRVDDEVPVRQRTPEAQEGLRRRYFPASGRPALRDVVLFDAAPGHRYLDDPAAVLAELRSRPDAPPALWTGALGQPIPAGVRRLAPLTEQWYEALATSRWVVTNDDLPDWFRRHPDQVVVRIARGWPVKRFGAAARNQPGAQELRGRIAAQSASLSALVSPHPSATPLLRQGFGFEGTVLEYSRPADDLLATADREQARAEVLRQLGLPDRTRLILYAPTRRPIDARKRGWSNPGRILDLPVVAAGLPRDHVLLARSHPALADEVVGMAPGVVDVSSYPGVGQLLLAADVLLTDYSALLADFAVVGRPILLYVPDLAQVEESPGLNVDLAAVAPGPLLRTADEVVAALSDLEAVSAEHEQAVKAFAESHGPGGEGRASARLIDWLLDTDR
ncbi:MAG TPA: CDP-glycerol glycerophosphotransferase family protein [Actinoplanes sp.]|nr:CDP-glycerol glycerophosphotransferase family protein [Actinoplanes sp.]